MAVSRRRRRLGRVPAPVPVRVVPVGRLDFATSGVLLATNDGDFAMGLLHPKKAVPKTYVVKVLGEMEAKDLDRWRKGVDLADGKTLPARVKLLRHEAGKTWFELTPEEHQRMPGDYEAQVSQGAITFHSEEHLVRSDIGIGMLRRKLLEQIKIVEDGGDPIGVAYEPGKELVRIDSGNFFEEPAAA